MHSAAANRVRSEMRVLIAATEREERGVDDIELLFDRQGPVVLQRRREARSGEVVRAQPFEMEVGKEDRRPACIVCRGVTGDDAQHDISGDDRDEDDEGRSGQDRRTPSSVEVEDRGATRRSALSQQQPGNDETGDDEEDVDADQPPVQCPYLEVVEENSTIATARRPSTSGRSARSSGAVPDPPPDGKARAPSATTRLASRPSTHAYATSSGQRAGQAGMLSPATKRGFWPPLVAME